VLRALLIHATSQKSTVRHQDLAPQRLGLAILVLVVMLFLRKFGRGIWQSLAALVGIIIGKMKFPSSQIVLNA
jgi:xanthine/uracil permease